MSITIRLANKNDYFITECLTREAFWDLYKPGCDEHLVLHQLRQSPAFIDELDYVACDNNQIIGNIVYSKAIIKNDKQENTVLCMGPLGVQPSHQGRGIGSLLMQTTLEKARNLGYAAVILFGNPGYYHRFGFINAGEYDIQTEDGQNFDAFMALDTSNNRLRTIYGKFFADKAFQIDKNDLESYELNFPKKEKHIKEGQFE